MVENFRLLYADCGTLLCSVQGDKDGCRFYINSNSFLLLVGDESVILDVMHFWGCLYSYLLDSTFKLWINSVYYCRIEERDVIILK